MQKAAGLEVVDRREPRPLCSSPSLVARGELKSRQEYSGKDPHLQVQSL